VLSKWLVIQLAVSGKSELMSAEVFGVCTKCNQPQGFYFGSKRSDFTGDPNRCDFLKRLFTLQMFRSMMLTICFFVVAIV
jgi:hypothetical protein